MPLNFTGDLPSVIIISLHFIVPLLYNYWLSQTGRRNNNNGEAITASDSGAVVELTTATSESVDVVSLSDDGFFSRLFFAFGRKKKNTSISSNNNKNIKLDENANNMESFGDGNKKDNNHNKGLKGLLKGRKKKRKSIEALKQQEEESDTASIIPAVATQKPGSNTAAPRGDEHNAVEEWLEQCMPPVHLGVIPALDNDALMDPPRKVNYASNIIRTHDEIVANISSVGSIKELAVEEKLLKTSDELERTLEGIEPVSVSLRKTPNHTERVLTDQVQNITSNSALFTENTSPGADTTPASVPVAPPRSRNSWLKVFVHTTETENPYEQSPEVKPEGMKVFVHTTETENPFEQSPEIKPDAPASFMDSWPLKKELDPDVEESILFSPLEFSWKDRVTSLFTGNKSEKLTQEKNQKSEEGPKLGGPISSPEPPLRKKSTKSIEKVSEEVRPLNSKEFLESEVFQGRENIQEASEEILNPVQSLEETQKAPQEISSPFQEHLVEPPKSYEAFLVLTETQEPFQKNSSSFQGFEEAQKVTEELSSPIQGLKESPEASQVIQESPVIQEPQESSKPISSPEPPLRKRSSKSVEKVTEGVKSLNYQEFPSPSQEFPVESQKKPDVFEGITEPSKDISNSFQGFKEASEILKLPNRASEAVSSPEPPARKRISKISEQLIEASLPIEIPPEVKSDEAAEPIQFDLVSQISKAQSKDPTPISDIAQEVHTQLTQNDPEVKQPEPFQGLEAAPVVPLRHKRKSLALVTQEVSNIQAPTLPEVSQSQVYTNEGLKNLIEPVEESKVTTEASNKNFSGEFQIEETLKEPAEAPQFIENVQPFEVLEDLEVSNVLKVQDQKELTDSVPTDDQSKLGMNAYVLYCQESSTPIPFDPDQDEPNSLLFISQDIVATDEKIKSSPVESNNQIELSEHLSSTIETPEEFSPFKTTVKELNLTRDTRESFSSNLTEKTEDPSLQIDSEDRGYFSLEFTELEESSPKPKDLEKTKFHGDEVSEISSSVYGPSPVQVLPRASIDMSMTSEQSDVTVNGKKQKKKKLKKIKEALSNGLSKIFHIKKKKTKDQKSLTESSSQSLSVSQSKSSYDESFPASKVSTRATSSTTSLATLTEMSKGQIDAPASTNTTPLVLRSNTTVMAKVESSGAESQFSKVKDRDEISIKSSESGSEESIRELVDDLQESSLMTSLDMSSEAFEKFLDYPFMPIRSSVLETIQEDSSAIITIQESEKQEDLKVKSSTSEKIEEIPDKTVEITDKEVQKDHQDNQEVSISQKISINAEVSKKQEAPDLIDQVESLCVRMEELTLDPKLSTEIKETPVQRPLDSPEPLSAPVLVKLVEEKQKNIDCTSSPKPSDDKSSQEALVRQLVVGLNKSELLKIAFGTEGVHLFNVTEQSPNVPKVDENVTLSEAKPSKPSKPSKLEAVGVTINKPLVTEQEPVLQAPVSIEEPKKPLIKVTEPENKVEVEEMTSEIKCLQSDVPDLLQPHEQARLQSVTKTASGLIKVSSLKDLQTLHPAIKKSSSSSALSSYDSKPSGGYSTWLQVFDRLYVEDSPPGSAIRSREHLDDDESIPLVFRTRNEAPVSTLNKINTIECIDITNLPESPDTRVWEEQPEKNLFEFNLEKKPSKPQIHAEAQTEPSGQEMHESTEPTSTDPVVYKYVYEFRSANPRGIQCDSGVVTVNFRTLNDMEDVDEDKIERKYSFLFKY